MIEFNRSVLFKLERDEIMDLISPRISKASNKFFKAIHDRNLSEIDIDNILYKWIADGIDYLQNTSSDLWERFSIQSGKLRVEIDVDDYVEIRFYIPIYI